MRRMLEEYVLNWFLGTVGNNYPANVGKRIVEPKIYERMHKIYNYFQNVETSPNHIGKRLVPNWLINLIKTIDYIDATEDGIANIIEIPAKHYNYLELKELGGMSYKCNNLFNKDSYNYSNKYYNGVGTLTSATDNSMHDEAITVLPNTQYTFSVNTAQAFLGVAFFNDNTFISKSQVVNKTSITFTTPNNCNKVYFNTNYNSQTISANYLSTIEPMLNVGDTALPYQPYFTGIRDSAVTSVVSKDSNNNTIDTYTIPAEVQALDGYGWGVNSSVYNYIDFETKKFIQKVGRVDLGTLSYTLQGTGQNVRFRTTINDIKGQESLSTPIVILSSIYTPSAYNDDRADMTIYYDQSPIGTQSVGIKNDTYNDATAFKEAMNGVYLYYELAEPVETDIATYIEDGFLNVKDADTIELTNTYNQDAPYTITYYLEV